MSKYIPADKLIAEIEKRQEELSDHNFHSMVEEFDKVIDIITSLQQEQSIEGKQVIIITETDGDANIKWDCRSLDDVIVLLKSAENFIAEKQIEKIAGPGSGPDYATTESRYSRLFKRRQEQPEVDLENIIRVEFGTRAKVEDGRRYVKLDWDNFSILARHFYGLRNRALEEAARHVYESWMGGTMDDVRRDMVELGRVINARKEG